MNKGVALASGEWINFMNAGDVFYNQRVLERIFDDKIDEQSIAYGIDIMDVDHGYDKYHVYDRGKNHY